MSYTKLAIFFVATSVVFLVFAAPATADGNAEKFAKTLAELRTEVDALSTKVSEQKRRQQSIQRSLDAQKTDVELQILREKGRIKQLEADLEKRRQKTAARSGESDALKPETERVFDVLRTAIASTLPFKRSERISQIDDIEKQYKAGLLTTEKALSRLWQVVEDEKRLARENGLYQDTISLDGEPTLVDVARVGMVAMYFQTNDGQVGYLDPTNDWTATYVTETQDVRQVHAFFEAFRKQIRSGYFELPGKLGAKQ